MREARRGGQEYLLERGLFRRKSTGEVADPAHLDLAFPHYWRYDVLRVLGSFRRSGAGPDPWMAQAVEVVRSKQQPDGRILTVGFSTAARVSSGTTGRYRGTWGLASGTR